MCHYITATLPKETTLLLNLNAKIQFRDVKSLLHVISNLNFIIESSLYFLLSLKKINSNTD